MSQTNETTAERWSRVADAADVLASVARDLRILVAAGRVDPEPALLAARDQFEVLRYLELVAEAHTPAPRTAVQVRMVQAGPERAAEDEHPVPSGPTDHAECRKCSSTNSVVFIAVDRYGLPVPSRVCLSCDRRWRTESS
jgi:hypothetical protein